MQSQRYYLKVFPESRLFPNVKYNDYAAMALTIKKKKIFTTKLNMFNRFSQIKIDVDCNKEIEAGISKLTVRRKE